MVAFIDCLHKIYESAVIPNIVFVSFVAFVVSFFGGEYLRPRQNVESFVARRSEDLRIGLLGSNGHWTASGGAVVCS